MQQSSTAFNAPHSALPNVPLSNTAVPSTAGSNTAGSNTAGSNTAGSNTATPSPATPSPAASSAAAPNGVAPVLPEQQPYWNELVGKAKSTNLRDLARHYGLFTAELQSALERTGSLSGEGSHGVMSEASPLRGAGGRANQKLEANRPLLGVIPDGEVAKRLDVARKTVVAFRKKHNIAKYRGVGAVEEEEVEEEEVTAEDRSAAGRPVSVTGRASKLDGFLDIIGKLPDREVAERCGMTTENVRMYRQRRNIPAEWRGEAGGTALSTPAARAPLAASGGRLVYEVRARKGIEKGRFALLAGDPVEAAQRAQAALSSRDEGWVIRSIRLVAEALPE